MPMIPNGTSSSVVSSRPSSAIIHSCRVWHMTNIISRHAFSSMRETNSTRHFLGSTVKDIFSNQWIWTNRCTKEEISQPLLSLTEAFQQNVCASQLMNFAMDNLIIVYMTITVIQIWQTQYSMLYTSLSSALCKLVASCDANECALIMSNASLRTESRVNTLTSEKEFN
jgi:hypothetical protein